jgi:hypothetical protein
VLREADFSKQPKFQYPHCIYSKGERPHTVPLKYTAHRL